VNLVYLPRARDDLREILDYIAQDNPAAARRVLTRIDQSVSILARHPNIGRSTEFPGLQKWSIPNLPYAAYYRIEGETVVIARVIHGARKWPNALND